MEVKKAATQDVFFKVTFPPFVSHSLLLAWCSPGAATWDWLAVSPAVIKWEQLGFFIWFIFFLSCHVLLVARMRSVVLVRFLGVRNHLLHKPPM